MEMKDTPMEVNKNDDVLEMPIKHNSTSKDQVSSLNEVLPNSKFVNFEQMKIAGEIEKQFPNDIIVQDEVRNLLKHSMPAMERQRKFEDFMKRNNRTINVQNYDVEAYEFFMNQSTKIETSDDSE